MMAIKLINQERVGKGSKAAAISAIGGGKLKLTKTITKPVYFTKLLGKKCKSA